MLMPIEASTAAAIVAAAAGVVGAIYSLFQVVAARNAIRAHRMKVAELASVSSAPNPSILMQESLLALTDFQRKQIESGLKMLSPAAVDAYWRNILTYSDVPYVNVYAAEHDKIVRGCGPAVAEAIERANDTLSRAARTIGWQERQWLYETGADAFANVLDMIAVSGGDAGKGTIHYLQQQRLQCLVGAGTKSRLADAAALCAHLESVYPLDPVVHYRLAQTLLKASETDRAAAEFARSAALLKDYKADEAAGYFPLSPDHWLRSALPRNLGFTYWQLSNKENEENSAKRCGLLEKAFSTTAEALQADNVPLREKAAVHSNLVYYATELVELCGAHVDAQLYRKKIEEHMQFLEANASSVGHVSLNLLDTMCRAYETLGKPEQAREIATRILNVVSARDGAQLFAGSGRTAREMLPLSDYERDIIDHAQKTLAALGTT